MADNPITEQLPADLPTNWSYGQTVAPSGAEAGLSAQHGYNYLMRQVNAAQEAINQVGEAFEGLATKDVTDGLQNQIDQKVPNTRKINKKPLSADISLTAEDVGAADAETLELVVENIGYMKNEFSEHIGNNDVHVIAGEKTLWNQNIVHQLNYTKSGTQHRLTGLTGLSGTLSCVFKATAAFAAGDTFTVDGTAYTVQLSNGETAEANLFVSGATVPVVVDTSGKKVNFKSAGGKAKLPAGTNSVVTYFNANSTFTVPQTGKYRITVIGKGGYGASGGGGTIQSGKSGGGGGSGGAAWKILTLTKGESYTITVNTSQTSFGNLLTALCGGNASSYNAGIGGTSSGGDTNLTGNSGNPGRNGQYPMTGGTGGNYTEQQNSLNAFLAFGNDNKGSYRQSGTAVSPSYTKLFYPYGHGGGGGGNYEHDPSATIAVTPMSGGSGCGGAVIVEFVA